MWQELFKMKPVLVILCLLIPAQAFPEYGVSGFLKEMIRVQGKPSVIVSFLKINPESRMQMVKDLSADAILFANGESLPAAILEEHTVFVADLMDRDTPDLLRKAEKRGMLNSPTRWVLLVDKQAIDNGNTPNIENNRANETFETGNEIGEVIPVENAIKGALSGVYIKVYSEVMTVIVDGGMYDAKMVYRLRPHMPLIFEPYGHWTSSRGFTDLRGNTVTSLRRQDFQRIHLTVSTIITDNDTLKHLGDYVDKHIDAMTKAAYHFTQHIAEFVNATTRLRFVRTWGYRQPNGSYDGLVSEFETGRADLAGSPIAINTDRMRFVEYVCVNSPMKAAFIFRKPPLSTVANIFLLPFSAWAWTAMMGLIVVVAACALVTWTWEDHKTGTKQGRTPKERVADALLDSLCLVFQQGTWKAPIFISGRIVLLIGLVCFMFLFTAYSAYIVALLQSTTSNINTLADLLASPLRLAVQDVGYSRFYFPSYTEPVRKAIWKQKLQDKGEKAFLPLEEGIKLMRQGLFAFHVERLTAYDMVQKTFYEEEKCHFQEIEFLQITYPYLTIIRDSPFKEQLKIASKRVLESGVQGRSNARILSYMPRCSGGSGGTFVSVKLLDCVNAFQCLLLGYGVALLFLMAELVVHRRLRSRKLKEDPKEQDQPSDIE